MQTWPAHCETQQKEEAEQQEEQDEARTSDINGAAGKIESKERALSNIVAR